MGDVMLDEAGKVRVLASEVWGPLPSGHADLIMAGLVTAVRGSKLFGFN